MSLQHRIALMARNDSFRVRWASNPAQFERPQTSLIERGWAGGANEDPPEAKWENWWHNRVDEALGELEALGAMRWFGDVLYSEMAEVSHGGVIYIAARPSNGIEPGSAADVGHWQRKPLGTRAFMHISSSQAIPDSFEGMALIDASAGVVTVTLPASNAALGIRDVIVHRADNSGNRLVVQATGTDRIKFHTHLNPAGYQFLVLMGAGDFWHLRSDGAGSWWPMARLDATPCGRVVTETSIDMPPGGYGPASGILYDRAQFPWLLDYAAQSGAFYTEAVWAGGNWGGWSSGDGATTFRGPELRGEFARFLDEGRVVDPGRACGSYIPDAMQGHAHRMYYEHGGEASSGASNPDGLLQISMDTSLGYSDNLVAIREPISDGVNGEPRTASETRPRSIAFPGRIKLI